MNYNQLKKFCSKNKDEIESLVGHTIRCQDKAIILKSYYDIMQQRSKNIEKYKLGKLLGKGGFGEVYKVKNHKIAIKRASFLKAHVMLEHELDILNKLQGIYGIPRLIDPQDKIIAYGPQNKYRSFAMQLLGTPLQDTIDKSFVCTLASQMLTIIQQVHERGIIHNDIKMANWLFGIQKDKYQIYLIDFGLAQCYRDSSGNHIPYSNDLSFRGTRKYSSYNVDDKIQPSRRDDLISLGYLLVSLYIQLPWTEVYRDIKSKPKKQKDIATIEAIKLKRGMCTSKRDGGLSYPSLPKKIKRYLISVGKLNFEENPDYEKLKNYFVLENQ